MNALKGLSLAVVGGGVMGLTLAVKAAWAGADVTVFAPPDQTHSASRVAAGMLAPAFEAMLDASLSDQFHMLRAARDLWPDFLGALGAPALDRLGALWIDLEGEDGQAERLMQRLHAVGADARELSPRNILTIAPWVTPQVAGGVFSPEDWRIDPTAALHALDQALTAAGGRYCAARVHVTVDGDWLAACEHVKADAYVIAAGDGWAAFTGAAPELAVLSPIKGQLVRVMAEPLSGPVLRARGGYLAPAAFGAIAGATMEAGASDYEAAASAAKTYADFATRLAPGLLGGDVSTGVGVRAAAPDGLPLVGRSSRPDTHLAIGLRRNGWLLAPLVADLLIAGLAGETTAQFAHLLRADRFSG